MPNKQLFSLMSDINLNNREVRFFNPFQKRNQAGPALLGHYTTWDNKRYELLFVGCGVFIGTKNMSMYNKLTYLGKSFNFDYYEPEESFMVGIAHVYYVKELVDYGSPAEFLNFYHQGRVIVESDGVFGMCHTVKFGHKVTKVNDDRSKAQDQAKLRGLIKCYLPEGVKGHKKFVNKGCGVWIKGKEYPALISFHGKKTQEGENCKVHGSVRIVTHKTFVGGWLRA